MDKASGVKDFFDLSEKLSAPAKKSLRERQREEAEAKRKREEEEAKAALKDFQKSLGVEDDDDDLRPNDSAPARIGTVRHFAPRGPRGNSGPGSLGPAPPSLSRKRALDGSQKDRDQGLFAFSNSGPLDAATAFRDSDDEDDHVAGSKGVEKAIPKPTMRLSSLPPSITTAEIKSMIPSTLTVEAVNISKNFDTRARDRKSTSAIVTLAQNTPAKDIDAVVNALEKRYLGFGFNLSISRHLSSASLDASGAGLTNTMSSSLPFGAKSIPGAQGQSMSRAPPPASLRGNQQFPSQYGPMTTQYGRGTVPTQITVKPPSDIKQLKLINRTIESLLNNGPEFEALLMNRPEVQRDQKWEWLWNARSPGGVWYRWKLWQTITGAETNPDTRSRFKSLEQRIFYDSAPWIAPEQPLPFEYTTKFEEFVSDPEYDSSDEEASDDEGPRRQQHVSGGPPEPSFDTEDALKSYLSPLKKSKFTHLLARLPTSTARLRRGDVARVSSFAINHADKGADEIVNMLVANIVKPFAFTSANPDRQKHEDEAEEEDADKKTEKEDPSSAKLIGLYIISDIFASCGTSGVRQAWRYREWFEAAFKKRKLFEHLGRLDKDLQWGRLRAEKWKRSINTILGMWDSGNVFSPAAQTHFVEVFNNPPLSEAEKQAVEKAEQEAARAAAKSKWKPVEVQAEVKQDENKNSPAAGGADSKKDDVDGDPMAEDVDEEPLDNGDVDGDPMDEDVDGEPMEDINDEKAAGEDANGEPMEEEEPSGLPGLVAPSEPKGSNNAAGETEAAKARKRRPRAEDMFADSEDE